MSLIFIQRFDKCIKVISDGCGWDTEGNVAWLGSKLRVAHDGKPLVLTGVGDHATVMLFFSIFEQITEQFPLERAIDLLGMELAALPTLIERLGGKCGFARLYLAGHTVERGLFQMVGEIDPSKADERPRWRIDETGQLLNVASKDKSVYRLRDNPLNLVEETFDGFVMPFVEWNRNQCVAGKSGGAAHHACGGKIEVATISGDGVTVQVVHDYGDVVGRPIVIGGT